MIQAIGKLETVATAVKPYGVPRAMRYPCVESVCIQSGDSWTYHVAHDRSSEGTDQSPDPDSKCCARGDIQDVQAASTQRLVITLSRLLTN